MMQSADLNPERSGYHRITALPRRAGWVVGKDRVERIWRREGADIGSNFRLDDCQYIYGLGAKSLEIRTSLVEINIGGAVVGTGTFSVEVAFAPTKARRCPALISRGWAPNFPLIRIQYQARRSCLIS